MSYSVRHQVFVSSTYTDLMEERAEVLQAIWELDCIPTGMEAFVASNESQWDVIKRVINECDYYVLIIGGRYGSVTAEGISYTEKEYRYAKELGIPVLAFMHKNPDDIAVKKSEKTDELREKLVAFRAEVMSKHPIREWTTATELGGLVSRSLIREIKVSPRPGWIRNDGSSPIALLEQIKELTEENRDLRERQAAQDDGEGDEDFEQGDDRIEMWGDRRIGRIQSWEGETADWGVLTTWDEIFRDLGPILINEATEQQMRTALSRFQQVDEIPDGYEYRDSASIAPECWNEIIIQLRALGYIASGEKKRGVNDRNSYWRITPKGDRHLVKLLARRRSQKNDDQQPSN